MKIPQIPPLRGMTPLGVKPARYEIKRMLEPQGTTFGIYKDGKLFQYGFPTEKDAQEWIRIRTDCGCCS